jgi:Na+-transporting NADH:ubiquinone oxidoreductase subunit F
MATIKIEDLTHDIKYVLLRLDEPKTIKFKPGQYVQFKVPQTDEFRAYSIASPPSQDNIIELIVRLVPGGLCSTYIHEVLDVNDQITLTGPFGDFYLREDSPRNIICIGGGCGMAPIRSILRHLAERGMPRKAMYFFGARSKKDLFFTEELIALERQFPNFRYIPALSEPKPQDNWTGETGLITQVVERIMPLDGRSEAYLCGPPPMIDASLKVLTKKGMEETHIYYDKF